MVPPLFHQGIPVKETLAPVDPDKVAETPVGTAVGAVLFPGSLVEVRIEFEADESAEFPIALLANT